MSLFWASLPNSLENQANWFADKKAVQEILTELNQYNKGVIARGNWRENRSWQTATLALQAWEQGIPVPKPAPAEQNSKTVTEQTPSVSTPESSKTQKNASESAPVSESLSPTDSKSSVDNQVESQTNTENAQ